MHNIGDSCPIVKKVISVKLSDEESRLARKGFTSLFGLTAIQTAVKLELTCNDWQKSERIEEGGYVHFHRV